MEKHGYINSINLKENSDFPYLVLDVVDDNACPRNPGFRVMHWHEDLQFIYVLQGTAEVCTFSGQVRVPAGSGIFINANVVHRIDRLGPCHYNSFIFPPHFLTFYPGSPATPFVEGVTDGGAPVFLLDRESGQYREALEVLAELSGLEKEKTAFYPYQVLSLLCRLWLALLRRMDLPEKATKAHPESLRLRQMLLYIERHYGEDVTLDALAASANVSKSACGRCFQACLNTSPYRYLTEYRLAKAAKLLEATDRPVGEVAAAVGFGQSSHFGKLFREKTGLSPKEYRKAKRQ